MTNEEREQMFELAKKCANKLNEPTSDDILDSTILIPRHTLNAGVWVGFVRGFMYAYKLYKVKQEEQNGKHNN